jgi:hypothetical protein
MEKIEWKKDWNLKDFWKAVDLRVRPIKDNRFVKITQKKTTPKV